MAPPKGYMLPERCPLHGRVPCNCFRLGDKVNRAPPGQVYLIGSLRNPAVTDLGNAMRAAGLAVFDDWHGAGPTADDEWQRYEKGRGRSYAEALDGHCAEHVFQFDLKHLNASDCAVLVMPAGKSGHLELGYMAGQGKRTFVLFDAEPERWDVMYKFVTKVCFSQAQLMKELGA